MKNYFLFFLLTLMGLQTYSQTVKFDVFDNLVYESENDRYIANLKEDIFEGFVFTDSRKNKLTYKKEYIEFKFPELFENKDARIDFFMSLIHNYRSDRRYEATFMIDIFDKIVIEDNKNNKTEIGQDIFGNATYKRRNGNEQIRIVKNISGGLEFKSNRKNATLEKNIFKIWNYTDSRGNKIEFGARTWNGFLQEYESKENIFMFLIDTFLFY